MNFLDSGVMVARLPVSRTLLNSYPLLVVIFGILAFVQLNSYVYVLAQDQQLDPDLSECLSSYSLAHSECYDNF